MIGRTGIYMVIAVMAIMTTLSTEAMARMSITCTGGRLYVEQTAPDGEEICWETNLTCSGEWTYSWLKAGPGNDSGATTVIDSSNARLSGEAAEKALAAQLLAELNQRDMKLYYKAPASVAASFKRRAGWPDKDKGPIVIGSPGPTFPDPPVDNLKTSKGYPPNGYPCLGCKPCPPPEDAYCDIVWSKRAGSGGLTEKDLAPRMAEQGYQIVEGKMILVSKTRFVDKSQHQKIHIKKNH